jgi:hypothetical protein
MLTRQPACENEIVPSLHSNLGAASAAGAGVGRAAVCWGAGARACGFGAKAQPAHHGKINKAEIDKAKPIRIRVASGKPLQQPTGLTSSSANRQPSTFSASKFSV